MSNLQTNVPLVNVPFVDKSGNVTEAWFLFLVQLWRRTGGNMPSPSTFTVADALALEETFPALTPERVEALAQMTTMGIIFPADADRSEMVNAPLDLQQPATDMVFPSPAQDVLDQTFSSGTNFTPGTTTTLTLAASFGDAARLWIFFDAAFQGDDQYTLSGTALTFTSAIPVGTNKVYVKGLM